MPNTIAAGRPRGGGAPATVVSSAAKIAESYADYLTDESRYGPANADCLVLAHDEEQVAAAIEAAHREGREVTVSAGRTGIVGGAVPRAGNLLSLSEMKRVLGLQRLDDGRLVVRAEPGLSIAELAERLEKKELGVDPAGLAPAERDALDAFLAEGSAYFYPPDPTEETAHLGATVATNASGARSFLYGATRKHVQGLRVVIPSGDVLDVERGQCTEEGGRFVIATGTGEVSVPVPSYRMPPTKNAAGYYAAAGMDLLDLFIGSEGTLGVVTEVRAVIAPRPQGILSALAFFDTDDEAIAFVRHARGDLPDEAPPGPVAPMALEFFDGRSLDFLRERKAEQGASSEIPELPADAGAAILFEQGYAEDDLPEIYDGWEALLTSHGSSMERTWGGMEEGDLAKLKSLRHGIAEEVNGTIARAKASHPEIHKIGTDAAVPRDSLVEMFAYYRDRLGGTSLRYVIFGHIGDSHLHLNIMPRDSDELLEGKAVALEVAERAVALGGTVSAEHGIGKLKHEFLRIMYGEAGLEEMAAVKRALDPEGVLNRGVMFPEGLLRGRGGSRA